jgi:hypothetical protein
MPGKVSKMYDLTFSYYYTEQELLIAKAFPNSVEDMKYLSHKNTKDGRLFAVPITERPI